MLDPEIFGIVIGLTSLAEHFSGMRVVGGRVEAAGPESFLTNGKFFGTNVTSTTSSGSALLTSFVLNRLDSFAASKPAPFFRYGSADSPGLVQKWLLGRAGVERKQTRTADFKRVMDQDPILWTIRVVEGLEYTLGFDQPYEGDDLTVGSEQFRTVSGGLAAALSGEGWRGGGAQAYGDCNAALKVRVAALADLDLQLAVFVKGQAEVTTDVRVGLATLKGLLLAAYVIEQVVYAVGPMASMAGRKWAYLACILGLTAATAGLATMLIFSDDHKNKADAAADQYTQLATGSGGAQSSVASDVAGAGRSMVSNFEDVISSRTPRMSTLADRAAAGVASGAGEPAELVTPGETRCGTTLLVSAMTMPTLAQVTWDANVAGHAQQAASATEGQAGPDEEALAQSDGGEIERAPLEAAPPAPNKHTSPVHPPNLGQPEQFSGM